MNLIEKIKTAPESISFSEVITYIDENFSFSPTSFTNGKTINEANQNNGSCKIFSFAKLQNLAREQTLNLFGDYYRKDVLGNSEGTDHQNIRNFMVSGWEGIAFDGDALQAK